MPLILVPTAYEVEILDFGDAPLAICGFGLAAAGAGASHAIATHQDDAADGVILVGAAGSFNPERAPIGEAMVASSVRCRGIGVGEGEKHHSAAELGWASSDVIDLPTGHDGQLLSVAAASGSLEQAARRAARHPEVVAEDMEGFAVAVAAQLNRVTLTIVRGISNTAGDRDPERWRMAEALTAAGRTVAGMLD